MPSPRASLGLGPGTGGWLPGGQVQFGVHWQHQQRPFVSTCFEGGVGDAVGFWSLRVGSSEMGRRGSERMLVEWLVVYSGNGCAFDELVAGQNAEVGGCVQTGGMLWSAVGRYQWRGFAIGQGRLVMTLS